MVFGSMKYRSHLWCAVFLVFFFSDCFAQNILKTNSLVGQKNVVLISAETNYPPFSYVNENGEATGFAIDIFKAAANAVNLKVKVELGLWSDNMESLSTGKVDAIAIMAITSEREKKYDFSHPYITLRGTAFVRRFDNSILKYVDLYGKQLLVMEKDNAHEYVQREKLSNNIITTISQQEAFRILDSGRCDAVITQQITGQSVLKELELTDIKPVKFSLPNYTDDFGFAVQKGNHFLLSALNEGLEKIVRNGEYDIIHSKWFETKDKPLINYNDIKRAIFYILTPIILIIGVLLIFILNKQVKKKNNLLKKEIDQHKKTLHNLQYKNSLLEITENVTQIGGWYYNPTNENFSITNGIYQIFGLDFKTDILNSYDLFLSLFMSEDQNCLKEELHNLFEFGGIYTTELEIVDRSNNRKWLKLVAKADRNQDYTRSIYGNLMDLSDLKKVRKDLDIKEKQYQSLFETMSKGVIYLNSREEVIDINPAALQMLSLSKDRINDNTFSKIKWYPVIEKGQVGEEIQSPVHITFKTGLSINNKLFGVKVPYVEGFTWILVDVKPEQLDEDNKVKNVVITLTDVTRIKETEQRLQKSEEMHRLLFENNPLPMCLYDPLSMKLINVNETACLKFGYTKEEFLSLPLKNFFPEDEFGSVQNDIQQASEKGYNYLPNRKYILKNGEIIYVDSYSQNFNISDLQARIVAFNDITLREKANQLIKVSEEKLRFAQVTAKMGSWSKDLVTGKFNLSENCIKLLGIDNSEIPQSLDEIFIHVHEEDKVHFKNFSWKNINYFDYSIQFRYILPDNSQIWLQSDIAIRYQGKNMVEVSGVFINISEKKDVESKLIQQNEKLSAIISSIPDKLFVHDEEGNFLEAYTTKSNDFIKPKSEFIGTNLIDVFGQELGEVNIKKIREAISKQELVTHVFSPVINNKIVNLEVRTVPFIKNKVIRFVRDITDQINNENEIRKLNHAVQQSPVSVVITDLDSKITYVNKAFSIITGYDDKEIIGIKPNVLKSGKQSDEFYKNLWKTINSGHSWEGDLINKKKNGTLFWEHMIITPVKNENDIITNFIAIKQDITERKKTEQKILELNEKLEQKVEERTLTLKSLNIKLKDEINERLQIEEALRDKSEELENFFSISLDFLCIGSIEGEFIKVNNSWENILGYEKNEILHTNVLNYIHPDDKLTTKNALFQLQQGQLLGGFINRFRAKNGEYLYLDWHVVPFNNLLYAAARDITAQKNYESILVNAQEEAFRANNAKSEFLANMSHEIRTPMNAILGYSNLLNNYIKNEREKEFLNSIITSGNSLLNLINDILDLSKVEAGKIDLKPEFIEVFSFFKEFDKIFYLAASEKGLKFEIKIKAQKGISIHIDASRLRQVIINLIGNAIKFTETGSVRLVASVINRKNQNTSNKGIVDVIIEVIDTGIGIPDDFKNNIFKSFVQLREFHTKGGTGLGLAISKQLINLMNGDIQVASELGKGSKFCVTIKNVQFKMHHRYEDEVLPINPSNIEFDRASIMVVDDIRENRQFIKDILYDTKIEIVEADSAITAFAKLEDYTPDLFIIDIMMPEVSGHELIIQLKNNDKFKHIPVYAYSASVMLEQEKKIKNNGFAGVLMKPLQIQDLYFVLMKHLPNKIITIEESKNKVLSSTLDVKNKEVLVTTLNNDFARRYESFKLRQPIDKIRDFGNDLVELAQLHNFEELKILGNELVIAAESFNIEKILLHLKNYKTLIDQL